MPILTFHALTLALVEPYKLSFGDVAALRTVYVKASGQGRMGLGEITPLPGYSAETPQSVRSALLELQGREWSWEQWEAMLAGMAERHPFTASGLACALETWQQGYAEAFAAPAAGPVPLTALCQAPDAKGMAARARALLDEGFTSLKIKAGHEPPQETAAKVMAAVGEAAGRGGEVRVDANGGFDWDDAVAFCRAVALSPPAWLEQPFKNTMLGRVAELTQAVDLPIFLDEAIWDEDDIRRASAMGVRGVKLKLCKHPGLAATKRLARLAGELGLQLIFGNGVQTALGNHLESVLFNELKLQRASEGNGFLKVAHSPFAHGLRIERGRLIDEGLPRAGEFFENLEDFGRITVHGSAGRTSGD